MLFNLNKEEHALIKARRMADELEKSPSYKKAQKLVTYYYSYEDKKVRSMILLDVLKGLSSYVLKTPAQIADQPDENGTHKTTLLTNICEEMAGFFIGDNHDILNGNNVNSGNKVMQESLSLLVDTFKSLSENHKLSTVNNSIITDMNELSERLNDLRGYTPVTEANFCHATMARLQDVGLNILSCAFEQNNNMLYSVSTFVYGSAKVLFEMTARLRDDDAIAKHISLLNDVMDVADSRNIKFMADRMGEIAVACSRHGNLALARQTVDAVKGALINNPEHSDIRSLLQTMVNVTSNANIEECAREGHDDMSAMATYTAMALLEIARNQPTETYFALLASAISDVSARFEQTQQKVLAPLAAQIVCDPWNEAKAMHAASLLLEIQRMNGDNDKVIVDYLKKTAQDENVTDKQRAVARATYAQLVAENKGGHAACDADADSHMIKDALADLSQHMKSDADDKEKAFGGALQVVENFVEMGKRLTAAKNKAIFGAVQENTLDLFDCVVERLGEENQLGRDGVLSQREPLFSDAKTTLTHIISLGKNGLVAQPTESVPA